MNKPSKFALALAFAAISATGVASGAGALLQAAGRGSSAGRSQPVVVIRSAAQRVAQRRGEAGEVGLNAVGA